MSPDAEPTRQQIANARAAGWDPDLGPPPGGWDVHGTPPPATTVGPSGASTNGIEPTDAEALFDDDGTPRS